MRHSERPYSSRDPYARMKWLERERRRRKRLLLCWGAAAILFLGAGTAALIHMGSQKKKQAEETVIAAENIVIEEKTLIDGISVKGMKRQEALETLLKHTPWEMSVTLGEKSYPVSNLYQIQAEKLLDTICTREEPGEYTVDMDHLEELAAAEASACAELWDIAPKNSGPESFDLQTGSFIFGESIPGTAVDQEKLAADILEAVKNHNYDAVILAETTQIPAEVTKAEAKEKYKTLASFTTETTSNAKRNTNVRLAAQALNGTIIQPGEEFSFNKIVGQRTEEKGYQAAAAYNSGAVVQEVGGGVCQISSTLYKVVFQSGMKITFRRSHTFEPNYVTPGQDATISWEEPDFRFVNTSKGPIGIRASYSNQKASVSIYGLPVLEEGITWDLASEKVEEMELPAPVYEEDPTLEPGQEIVKSAGTRGSRWVTYKVVYQNGKEIERTEDHSKTYKGHAPVIRRNTSGVMLKPEETQAPESTSAAIVDGMPDGYIPGSGMELVPEESQAESESKKESSTPLEGSPAARPETPRETAAAKETTASKGTEEARETAASKGTEEAGETAVSKETEVSGGAEKTEAVQPEVSQTIAPKPED